MYTSLHKNNPSSEEEKLIQDVVEDIYKLESKISDITQNLEKKIATKNNIELESLNKKESENNNKIKEIKNASEDKIKQIEFEIKKKQMSIDDLNKEITKLKSQLNYKFNSNNFHSLLLNKYILSNNLNEFLTNSQINNIISNSIEANQKSKQLKKLQSEYEMNLKTKNLLQYQIEDLKNKILSLQEILNMMKEEKITVKEELINFISQKESLEEVLKIKINNFSNSNNNNNVNYNNLQNNENNENIINNNNNPLLNSYMSNTNDIDIELYPYEIKCIDSTKIGSFICEGLIEMMTDSSTNNNNNNFFLNENNLNNINISKEFLAEFNESTEIYNELNNNISNNNLNINSNTGFNFLSRNQVKSSFNKDNLLKNIINEINNFQKTHKIINSSSTMSFCKNYKNPATEFIDSLSGIILNTFLSSNNNFNNFNINLSVNDLSNYLKNAFKIFYYEYIIETKLNFINKEYKVLKKERKKLLEKLNLNLSQILSKNDDLQNKMNELEMSIKLIKEEIEKDNYNNLTSLTENERSYIEICSKGNIILKNIKEINDEILHCQKNIMQIQKEQDDNLLKIQKELDNIKIAKDNIKIEIENEKLKSNDEIIRLRKLIAEKYSIIKTQLQIYKSKNGSNLSIYNKFLDSINNSINNNINNKNNSPTYLKASLYLTNSNNTNSNNNTSNANKFNNNNENNNTIYKTIFCNNGRNNNSNIEKNNNNSSFYDNSIFSADKKTIDQHRNNKNINNSNLSNYSMERINLNNSKIINKIPLKKKLYQVDSNSTIFNKKTDLHNRTMIQNCSKNNNNGIMHDNNDNEEEIIIDNRSLNEKKYFEPKKPLRKNYSSNYMNSLVIDRTNHNNDFSMNNINNKYINNNTIINQKEPIFPHYNNNIYKREKYSKINIKKIPKNHQRNNPNIPVNISNVNSLNSSNCKPVNNRSFYSSQRIMLPHTLSNHNILQNKVDISNSNYYNSQSNNINDNNYDIQNPNNVSSNTNNTSYLEEREKVSKTISNLKENISPLTTIKINPRNQKKGYMTNTYNSNAYSNINNKYGINNSNTNVNKIINKIYPLTKNTLCYFREYSRTNQKFDPLYDNNLSENNLINPPYNFFKGNICLSKDFHNINLISSIPVSSNNEININSIDNTVVNSTIKKIIEIYREYKKFKNSNLDIDDEDIILENFAELESLKQYHFNKNEIIKSALNKNFNFSLLVNQTQRIEFIICNFDDFKLWINGIALIIKNKNDILNYI